MTSPPVPLELGPRTLAQVAHDVRSPTSSIVAFLDLAAGEEDLDESSFEDLLPLAQRGVSRLLLLADLLTILSDVLESPSSVMPVPTEANSFVEAAVRAAARISKHTLVNSHVPPDVHYIEIDPGVTIPCVSALIGQVWRRWGTTVAVRMGRCEQGVELRIEPEEQGSDLEWTKTQVDDETSLGERVTALVLHAQGSGLERRQSKGRANAFRMVLPSSTAIGASSRKDGGTAS